MKKIKIYKLFRFLILVIISSNYSFSISCASPWAAVGEIELRNDVEILASYGVISGPVNTWPISWKQITENLSQASSMNLPPYVYMAVLRVRDKVPSEFNIKGTIHTTNKPAVVRGFDNKARNDFDSEAIAEFNSEGGTTVHLQGGYRSGNGEDYANLDGSYISQDIGNWSTYVGAIDRWWGPGRESTLILSNNVRPMPSVGLRRIDPKAFENKWFSWMGPWQWDMFVAKMEEDRYVPNTVFIGMRASFAPTKNFNVGVSRTLQLCGEGRPCNFSSWTKALISIGDLDNPTTPSGKAVEPGNQLASIDLSYSLKVGERTNLKLYAEGTAEDLLVFLPYEYAKMVGISTFGPYGDSGANWRLSGEFSDTIATLVWFGGRRREHVIYNHHLYRSGYRYKGRSIGHSLDTDSQLITISGEYISQNNWSYNLKYNYILLNRNGDAFYQSSVSSTEEHINLIEASISGYTWIGKIQLQARVYDDQPNTPLEKEAGVDFGFSWSVSY